jgi:peptidoglycan lytic transglycosylase
MQAARPTVRVLLCSTLLCWLALLSPAAADDLARQRELFLKVEPAAERGDWSAFMALPADEQQLLRDYVLWPDLRAAWLKASVATADPAEIEIFLAKYGALKPARELRYRYALHLARADDLAGFLTIYESFYQGLEIAKLDCLALRAEIAAGRTRRIVNRAVYLWTSSDGRVDECEPVFSFLVDRNLLGPEAFQERFKLAIDARDFAMAGNLGKSIDQQHIDVASRWLKAQREPASFLRDYRQWPNDTATHAQLVFAIERVTYDDPLQALEFWNSISADGRFPAAQEYRTSRNIALWMARDNLPGAYAQLTALPAPAQSDEVLRWRARLSLRDRAWSRMLDDVDRMSASVRDSDEWRYWRGMAMRRTGRREEGTALLQPLAHELGYYGFLAADELGLSYAFPDEAVRPDEATIARLTELPELARARELFFVGQDGRGRSEWDAVVSPMKSTDKLQAAILAQRWGWHSRAIFAAAGAGGHDDLALRYPLAFPGIFEQNAKDANIPPTWAYGVARSESLFMRDVRSRAGAIGLMQLMPATGREVAREINLPYSGLTTLTDPQSNVRLGTAYLARMAERYGGNRVLATAAYNAGPKRVDGWLPASGSMDARIWIENIPFEETRQYVRRVLEAETIFHFRMTGEMHRLSDDMLLVQAATQAPQVADNTP